MRVTKILVGLGLVLLVASCGPFESLSPLCTEEDCTFEQAIIGTWTGSGENSVNLTFQKAGDRAYEVIETGTDDETHNQEEFKYEGHLVRLGDVLFLDLALEEPFAKPGSYKLRLIQAERGNRFEPSLLKLDDLLYVRIVPRGPNEGGDSEDESYELRVDRGHWFFKISVDGDELRLAYIEDSWISKMSDHAKVDVGYEDAAGGVLTASTEDLQKFMLEHAEDEEAFSKDNTLEFVRKK